MIEGISAYPLYWPPGYERHRGWRERAKFQKNTGANKRARTVNESTAAVIKELRMLGITDDRKIVISTDLKLRLDGYPLSNQREPADPGVSVWWVDKKGLSRVMASDGYDRIADNLYAIALSLEALRGLSRWKCSGLLERAMNALVALPAPVGDSWWEVLGVKRDAPEIDIREAYVDKRKRAHPDHIEGSHDAFIRVSKAWEECCKERGFNA
jgi:hypothetical protein